MNKEKVIKELKDKYPGKNIILNDEKNPTEIVCETKLFQSTDSPSDAAIAVIDKSIEHVHKHTTEIYTVLRGELELYVDGTNHSLKEGDEFTIEPGQVHSAKGNETWIEAKSTPPWSPDDHILTK